MKKIYYSETDKVLYTSNVMFAGDRSATPEEIELNNDGVFGLNLDEQKQKKLNELEKLAADLRSEVDRFR